MTNTMIDATAITTLEELIADARAEGTPINDDDFADAAEINLIHAKIDFDHDDLALIARRMIKICDLFGISH